MASPLRRRPGYREQAEALELYLAQSLGTGTGFCRTTMFSQALAARLFLVPIFLVRYTLFPSQCVTHDCTSTPDNERFKPLSIQKQGCWILKINTSHVNHAMHNPPTGFSLEGKDIFIG